MRSEYYLNKQRDNFHKGCKELLFLLDDILQKEQILFFLNYGTLLGAYRDKNFIKHDYDMDLAVDLQYVDKIKQLMKDNGLKIKFETRFGEWDSPVGYEIRFEYNNTFVDFDFFTFEEGKAITFNTEFIKGQSLVVGKRTPVITEKIVTPFSGLVKYSFLGREFYIPKNTEEYIVANYGPYWRRPIKDFDYHDYATNIFSYTYEEMHSSVIVYY